MKFVSRIVWSRFIAFKFFEIKKVLSEIVVERFTKFFLENNCCIERTIQLSIYKCFIRVSNINELKIIRFCRRIRFRVFEEVEVYFWILLTRSYNRIVIPSNFNQLFGRAVLLLLLLSKRT